MNVKSKEKIIILIVVGFCIFNSINGNILTKNNKVSTIGSLTPKTSKVFEKIHVKDNWTDTKAAGICTGEGIYSNPYIIENLEINAQYIGSCILIENTTEYFIIRNCTLINSGYGWTDSGIRTTNVSNAQIIGNILTGNKNGMYVDYCSDFIISNNTSINSNDIQTLYCDNFLIYLNNFESNLLSIYIRNTTFSCRSPKQFVYVYNGKTFTNYLGNYWSDYPDPDDDGDGIGDISHKFYNSIVLEVDHYPLMEDTSHYQIIGIAGGLIPGYHLYLILGLISIISVILIRRNKTYCISE